jgi:hypothetical protein
MSVIPLKVDIHQRGLLGGGALQYQSVLSCSLTLRNMLGINGSLDPEVRGLRCLRATEMPGDPKECREHARRCAELARTAASPEAREHFTSLQKSWTRLAAEIESSLAFLETIDQIGSERSPPAEAAE